MGNAGIIPQLAPPELQKVFLDLADLSKFDFPADKDPSTGVTQAMESPSPHG